MNDASSKVPRGKRHPIGWEKRRELLFVQWRSSNKRRGRLASPEEHAQLAKQLREYAASEQDPSRKAKLEKLALFNEWAARRHAKAEQSADAHVVARHIVLAGSVG